MVAATLVLANLETARKFYVVQQSMQNVVVLDFSMGVRMKQLSGRRKASKALGDDVTFTRFIRTSRGHTLKHTTPPMPANATGTRFPNRVLRPDQMKTLLVSGHSNIKIGRDCRVGKLRGYWIYTLSLEERRTCPNSCSHWRTCYGNSEPLGKRIDHTHPDFLQRLDAEIAGLMAQAKRRRGAPGIILRLHALGDFYSTDYVDFWGRQLDKHPRLVLFGYTAWAPLTAIGARVDRLIDLYPGRAMIRFSNGGMVTRSTVPIVDAEDCPPGAFVCPEQTGQFEACGKCGACWTTLKNVAFMAH